MSNDPLVSIITPSFNQAPWLTDNLRSVASQDYNAIEHIVADGGSTDGSIELLDQAGPSVRWTSEPDDGQSDAINKGFRRARGSIIGWINSDDAYFSTDVVSSVVACFQANPDVSVVYGHAALVNAEGLILHYIWVPPLNYRVLRLHSFIVQPTVFFRSECLENQLVDAAYDYAMDRELWLRLAKRVRFHRIDKVLAVDRHYLGRKSHDRKDLRVHDTEMLHRTYGVPVSRLSRLGAKFIKLPLRALGTKLLFSDTQSQLAFDGRLDSRTSLIWRQLGTRRSAMPLPTMTQSTAKESG